MPAAARDALQAMERMAATGFNYGRLTAKGTLWYLPTPKLGLFYLDDGHTGAKRLTSNSLPPMSVPLLPVGCHPALQVGNLACLVTWQIGKSSVEVDDRARQPGSTGRVPVYDVRDLGFCRLILAMQHEMCAVYRRGPEYFGLPADNYAIQQQLGGTGPFSFSLRFILEIDKGRDRSRRGGLFSPFIGHEHEPRRHIFLLGMRPQRGKQLVEVTNRILGD